MTERVTFVGEQTCWGMEGHDGTQSFKSQDKGFFAFIQPSTEIRFSCTPNLGNLVIECPKKKRGTDGIGRCTLGDCDLECGWDLAARHIPTKTAEGREANCIVLVQHSNGRYGLKPSYMTRQRS